MKIKLKLHCFSNWKVSGVSFGHFREGNYGIHNDFGTLNGRRSRRSRCAFNIIKFKLRSKFYNFLVVTYERKGQQPLTFMSFFLFIHYHILHIVTKGYQCCKYSTNQFYSTNLLKIFWCPIMHCSGDVSSSIPVKKFTQISQIWSENFLVNTFTHSFLWSFIHRINKLN